MQWREVIVMRQVKIELKRKEANSCVFAYHKSAVAPSSSVRQPNRRCQLELCNSQRICISVRGRQCKQQHFCRFSITTFFHFSLECRFHLSLCLLRRSQYCGALELCMMGSFGRTHTFYAGRFLSPCPILSEPMHPQH